MITQNGRERQGSKDSYEGKPPDGVLEDEQEFASGQEDGDSMCKDMFGARRGSVFLKIMSEVGGVRRCA